MKFKKGDVVKIKYCKINVCRRYKRCVGSVREIVEVIDLFDIHQQILFVVEEPYVVCTQIARNIRMATDRERFLYYTHGPLKLRDK